MTKQDMLKKADDYKSLIETNRPFNKEQLTELDNYFKISFTFSSNSMDEKAGFAEAYDYMLSLARTEQLVITETMINKLHFLCYHRIDQEEAGQYRKIQVYPTGTANLPPKPEDVPHLMEHFMNQIQSSKKLMHPIEFAALCHKRLTDIHPFKEGNNSVARLFMNLILENAGYGVISIPRELRSEYKNALLISQNKNYPDIDGFIKFIAERVIEAERDCCRLLDIK